MFKAILGGLVLAVVVSTGAFAGSIDGSLSDWGVTPGANWNNTVGASQWLETGVGSNGYVGPGWGGQPFNVEALYLQIDATYLHYAIVTGFPETGTTNDGTKYYPGDIFFDFQPFYVPSGSTTPTGVMNFAIETTSYDTGNHTHGGKTSEGQGAGSFYSDVTPTLAGATLDDVFYPVEIKRSGTSQLAAGTLVGATDFVYNDTYYGSDHWVMEGQVPLSYFGDLPGEGGYLWWTMTCSNDIGRLSMDIPMGQIPEPGTILLTGSGLLLGVGYLLRRRMK